MTDFPADTRLHKPGVVGSSPTAASFSLCHTPAEEYHGWQEVSCSQLKSLRESPLEFYHRHEAKSAPARNSEALAYGTLLHTWAEVGEQEFWPRVERCPDALATSAGAFSSKAKDWLAALDPTRIAIAPADYQKLRDQTRALLDNPDVVEIISQAVDAEFNLRWQWNGHAVRGRIDGATDRFFFDWKTTRDKNPEKDWWRSAIQFGYHLQSAMYQAGGIAAGWPDERMRFIVTSTVWPYENCVVVLPQRLIDIGRRECLRLLDELEMRRDLNCWHRLTTHGVRELYVPAYAMREE